MSWIVLLRTWPRVRTPVIFGGGMTMEKGVFAGFAFASKSRFSIQRAYHFGSTLFGSYVFESSAIATESSGGAARLQNEKGQHVGGLCCARHLPHANACATQNRLSHRAHLSFRDRSWQRRLDGAEATGARLCDVFERGALLSIPRIHPRQPH